MLTTHMSKSKVKRKSFIFPKSQDDTKFSYVMHMLPLIIIIILIIINVKSDRKKTVRPQTCIVFPFHTTASTGR